MLKHISIQFLFCFYIINFNTSSCNNAIENDLSESNENALYEQEAKSEIKKQLYDMYNYIIMNNHIIGAETISPMQVNTIIEDIIDKEEIKKRLIPIIMLQIGLRAQNKNNNYQAILNNEINYYSSLGFYFSLPMMLFNCGKHSEYTLLKYTYIAMQPLFFISTLAQVITLKLKRHFDSQREYITKTNSMLQDNKIEMNNMLINFLINALEEEIKK